MILIGVVSTGSSLIKQILSGDYGKAIRRAGGIPVFLTWKKRHANFWAAHLDGFLFTGGGDPDPKYYGQSMLPECGTPNVPRDEFELALLKAAVAAGKPVLGICRGEQMLNVALGGTLIQDIPSQRPEAAAENHRDEAGRLLGCPSGRVPVHGRRRPGPQILRPDHVAGVRRTQRPPG